MQHSLAFIVFDDGVAVADIEFVANLANMYTTVSSQNFSGLNLVRIALWKNLSRSHSQSFSVVESSSWRKQKM